MKKKAGLAAATIVAVGLVLAVILWLTVDKADTVGICFRESAGTENAAYRQQLKQKLEACGFEVIVMDADGDQAKQYTQMEELAHKKCDVLLIEPVMAETVQELLTVIRNTELPAVLLNRQLDTTLLENDPQIAYIGSDETQPGTLQAQMIQNLSAGGDLNGDGAVSYMLIQGPQDHQDAAARTESFEREIQNSGLICQQLVKDSGDWSLESGRRICKQQLAVYGKDIEVIVCGNEQMALGAAQAIEDGGRTVGKDVYLLAIGGEGETLKMIREGKITATVYSDPAAQIDAIAETVLAKFREQPVQSIQILPYIIVTAENVKQYY